MSITGKIHSFQSLGTVDGPGVRFVVFMQGCNLRCSCCHNPDTWDISIGKEYAPEEIVERVKRYKEYFGPLGGITVSGGEPLLQPDFVKELFLLCKENGINTCLDTSGSILNDKVKELLEVTDYVLLDIKYTDNERYKKYVGCAMDKPIAFLQYLESLSIPTTVRQVIIPEINGSADDIKSLDKLLKDFKCVEKVELLPFKKICISKYESLNLEFPFANMREPSREEIKEFNRILQKEGV